MKSRLQNVNDIAHGRRYRCCHFHDMIHDEKGLKYSQATLELLNEQTFVE